MKKLFQLLAIITIFTGSSVLAIPTSSQPPTDFTTGLEALPTVAISTSSQPPTTLG
jgi:hypothetical protein